MTSKLTIPFSVIGLVAFAWACSAAFGSKADKTETEALRNRVQEIEKAHAVLSLKIDYVIRDTTDANGKLDYIIKEMGRNRDNHQPPSPTPIPLNR